MPRMVGSIRVGRPKALIRVGVSGDSGGSPKLFPFNQPITSSLQAPNSDDLVSGSELWGQHYSDYKTIGGNYTGIQIEYGNWIMAQPGGENTPSTTIQIKSILEYPIGGTQYPITWSGVTQKTLAALASTGLSDVSCTLGLVIPNGALFRVWTERIVSSTFFAFYNRNPSQSSSVGGTSKGTTGPSGTPPIALGTTTSGWTSINSYNPTMIYGKSDTKANFYMFTGESNMVDQNHDYNSSGVASWAGVAAATHPIFKCCSSGSGMFQQGAMTRRLAIAQSYGCTDIFVHFSSNDLSGSRTLLQMQTDATSIANIFNAVGIKVHLWTCNPFGVQAACGSLLSPPAYEGIRNSFNAWVLANSNVTPFSVAYDWNGFVEDSGDLGFWRQCVSSSDGLHYLQSNAGLRTSMINNFNTFLTANGLQ